MLVVCDSESAQKYHCYLAGFKKALRGFSVEKHLNPIRGPFSDFGGVPGCNSDFLSVTPTFGL